MKETEAKIQYDFLLDNGDLYEFFPTLSGNWAKDKKEFLVAAKENEDLLNG